MYMLGAWRGEGRIYNSIKKIYKSFSYTGENKFLSAVGLYTLWKRKWIRRCSIKNCELLILFDFIIVLSKLLKSYLFNYWCIHLSKMAVRTLKTMCCWGVASGMRAGKVNFEHREVWTTKSLTWSQSWVSIGCGAFVYSKTRTRALVVLIPVPWTGSVKNWCHSLDLLTAVWPWRPAQPLWTLILLGWPNWPRQSLISFFGPPCLKSKEHSLAFAMSSFILEIFHESFHFHHFHQFHMESYIRFFVTYSFLFQELFIFNKPGHKYGEGNGNSFQYSCLENPTDGGAW